VTAARTPDGCTLDAVAACLTTPQQALAGQNSESAAFGAIGAAHLGLRVAVDFHAFGSCSYTRLDVKLGDVRHVDDNDLDELEPLLEELRKLPQLRERKRGTFSRGSRAFLHFHADEDDFYVDVRLDTSFERMRVTGSADRAEFLEQVRRSLQSNGSSPVAQLG
jgi:hypothetical protein